MATESELLKAVLAKPDDDASGSAIDPCAVKEVVSI